MTPTPTNADDVTVRQLNELQDWLREPDHAEHFGQREIIDWLNRRPTHVVPKAIHALRIAHQAAGEVERLRDALKVADDAIREMFRYFDGGETRGSYDGKPERNQLRMAGQVTRAALAIKGGE
jgi:hypothetical protein